MNSINSKVQRTDKINNSTIRPKTALSYTSITTRAEMNINIIHTLLNVNITTELPKRRCYRLLSATSLGLSVSLGLSRLFCLFVCFYRENKQTNTRPTLVLEARTLTKKRMSHKPIRFFYSCVAINYTPTRPPRQSKARSSYPR